MTRAACPRARRRGVSASSARRASSGLGGCVAGGRADDPAQAASPERLAERAAGAGEFFLGLFEDTPAPADASGGGAAAADADGGGGELVGFVCGTTAAGRELTEETMGAHAPGGALLCVHSVVVAPRLRRRGAARAMLGAYLRAVAAGGGDGERGGGGGVREVGWGSGSIVGTRGR